MKNPKYSMRIANLNWSISGCHVKNITDAARQLAYRYAKLIYGKNAVIYDCNELYSSEIGGEFITMVGKYDRITNKFEGHKFRFILLKE
jgi:hypothetical protein